MFVLMLTKSNGIPFLQQATEKSTVILSASQKTFASLILSGASLILKISPGFSKVGCFALSFLGILRFIFGLTYLVALCYRI